MDNLHDLMERKMKTTLPRHWKSFYCLDDFKGHVFLAQEQHSMVEDTMFIIHHCMVYSYHHVKYQIQAFLK